METPVYLINLDGSLDRLKSARDKLSAVGMDFIRIPAFDGRELSVHDYAQYSDEKARRYMGRSMTGGEIGCYVSHQNAAAEFLRSGAAFGVVLEDDFTFADTGAETLLAALDWLSEQPLEWDVVNIGAEKRKIATPLHNIGSHSIAWAHYFPMTTTGLIWSRTGATRFIEHSQKLFAPVDNFLRHWQTRENRGLSIWPPITPAADFESEIGKSARKNKSGRTAFYGLAKQQRLWTDKALAFYHKLKSS